MISRVRHRHAAAAAAAAAALGAGALLACRGMCFVRGASVTAHPQELTHTDGALALVACVPSRRDLDIRKFLDGIYVSERGTLLKA